MRTIKRFFEKKDHLINRNPNLTPEKKSEIIGMLGRHPSYENKINWNKNNSLTYDDFLNVLRPLYINELDPRGLIEGQDYDILYKAEGEVLYIVHTYEASKILASNSVGPEIWTYLPDWVGAEEREGKAHAFGKADPDHNNMSPGAKWCISMQTSKFWWGTHSANYYFFFWFRDKDSLEDKRKLVILVNRQTLKIKCKFDADDEELGKSVPAYIAEAINKAVNPFKEREVNEAMAKLKLNPQTGRYDCPEGLDYDTVGNFFAKKDGDGFIVNFGKVEGDFDCSEMNLTSLKGAPTEVAGSFSCRGNHLTSLEGAPRKVGKSFNCSSNSLASLEGAPEEVKGSFHCGYNDLTSLEGIPTVGSLHCYHNKITSLRGLHQDSIEDLECHHNQLTSLEGTPSKVLGSFDCGHNKLTSLKGAPSEVQGSFDCSYNKLTSLEGAPRKVEMYFDCAHNKLTSLKGAPEEVEWSFDCKENPKLGSLEGIGKVGKEIYKDF